MAYSIKLAGQDITLKVDQLTIEIDDTLGQGGGAGSSGSTQGRAATIKMNTSLGPMNTAVGAGEFVSGGPLQLVRQGELVVTDTNGAIIFGGFATKYTDTTTSVLGQTIQNFTAIEGVDYSTSLQRTLVNEVFSAQTDVQIIQFVINKYAPWVSLSYLPATGTYLFSVKVFRNVTVEQILQTIAGVTGFLVFVDYLKNLHYIPPTTASSAPFNLSDTPDFATTFPHFVEELLTDDNAIINRVLFSGGTKLSNDFTQDLSPMANSNNTTFVLAYYPAKSSDGNYHVTVNGVEQVIGFAGAGGINNTLISAGGNAQVLIDPGSKTLTFNTAPATGATVFAKYRYSFPLSLVVTDEASHRKFGNPYLDGTISDNTIFDVATGIQRCKILLSQQSLGLTTLKVGMYKPGVQAGMIIRIKNSLRGINATYLVQEVLISPLGAGNFIYHLTLGAWNWNLIDFLLKLPTLPAFADTNVNETTEFVDIEQLLSKVQVHDVWSKKTSTQGLYYCRATPVGDGSDSFPGFATVTT